MNIWKLWPGSQVSRNESQRQVPKNFLESVFLSSVDKSPSFVDYCVDFQYNKGKRVSKQGINKRFNENLKAMLQKLVGEVMSKQWLKNNMETKTLENIN